MITFPKIAEAEKLNPGPKRLFIGAYGFEPRAMGWCESQINGNGVIDSALLIRYINPKGRNKIKHLDSLLNKIGASQSSQIKYSVKYPHNIEFKLKEKLQKLIVQYDEIVIDITAMTKLLILVSLLALKDFSGKVHIVYSEAETYAPSKDEYESSKHDIEMIAKFPCRGVESIIRMKCISSVRMQGQPVCLIAFTSFNEQLVRHMLGTISPHKLIFINGSPPRPDFKWRERATYEIHSRLYDEYATDNFIKDRQSIKNIASTLNYFETIQTLDSIYSDNGYHNRIICAATGSKMQTVGLFFSKIKHPDIHIEYPTPDSYFFKGLSSGIRKIYSIEIDSFSLFLDKVS